MSALLHCHTAPTTLDPGTCVNALVGVSQVTGDNLQIKIGRVQELAVVFLDVTEEACPTSHHEWLHSKHHAQVRQRPLAVQALEELAWTQFSVTEHCLGCLRKRLATLPSVEIE